MTAEIHTIQQTLEITEVGDVQVSAIVEDEDYGGYVRTITIYNEQGGAAAATMLVQIKIRSTTRTNIDIVVPTSTF